MPQYYNEFFHLETEEQIREARAQGSMAIWMSDDGKIFRTPPYNDLALHCHIDTNTVFIVSFLDDSPQFPIVLRFSNLEEIRYFRRAFIQGNV